MGTTGRSDDHILARCGTGRHPLRRAGLASRQIPPTEPDLRTLFLRIASTLPSRPDPRWVWDDVGRAEPRSPYPWEHLQAPIRGAIAAGAGREDVTRFYAGLMGQALDLLAQRDAETVPTTVLTLLREETEALGAQAEAHASGTDDHIARAARETREAIAHGEHYLAGLAARRLALVP